MTARSPIRRRARIARAAFGIVSLAAAVGSVFVAPGARGILGACLALLMCAIALYDARYFIIPNWLNAAALVLGLVQAAVLEPQLPGPEIGLALALVLALLRGALSGGVFLAIGLGYRWLRGRDGIGMGDIKLAAVAGVWLDGFALLAAIEIAVGAALGAYLLRQYLTRRPVRATSALPFGLYLAPAIWAGWLLEITLLAP
jgi:leader peptidase (prepilin peptidase) / N-methyltransferase